MDVVGHIPQIKPLKHLLHDELTTFDRHKRPYRDSRQNKMDFFFKITMHTIMIGHKRKGLLAHELQTVLESTCGKALRLENDTYST